MPQRPVTHTKEKPTLHAVCTMSCVLVCTLNKSTTATAHEGMQCLEHSCISPLTVAVVHMQAGGSRGDETIGRIPDHVTRSMYGCPSDIGNQNIRQHIAIYPAAEDMQSSDARQIALCSVLQVAHAFC